jgi:hypothetical protein
MPKIAALLLSLLLLLHAAVAGAASVPCCFEDCPASAACAEGTCAGCAMPGVMPAAEATRVTAPEQADSARPIHPVPELAHRVWTPPD